MNIQKLKQELINNLLLNNINNKDRHEIIVKLFDQFEQSNKSEEEPEILRDLFNNHCENYVATMAVISKEIEGMKKEIFEQYAYTKKYIACIDECRAEIETMKKQVELLKDRLVPVVGICETKQERFYPCQSKITKDFNFYRIIDDKQKINILLDMSKIEAIEICKALNSLEASKNAK